MDHHEQKGRPEHGSGPRHDSQKACLDETAKHQLFGDRRTKADRPNFQEPLDRTLGLHHASRLMGDPLGQCEELFREKRQLIAENEKRDRERERHEEVGAGWKP